MYKLKRFHVPPIALPSEQAFEAVHSDMKRMWEQGWKVSTTNKDFGVILQKFLVPYNSNNL